MEKQMMIKMVYNVYVDTFNSNSISKDVALPDKGHIGNYGKEALKDKLGFILTKS